MQFRNFSQHSQHYFAIFLIRHITVIFDYFSQNGSVILKIWKCYLVPRRETNETLICCTIAEILVDF